MTPTRTPPPLPPRARSRHTEALLLDEYRKALSAQGIEARKIQELLEDYAEHMDDPVFRPPAIVGILNGETA